jgi:hypothetical protein
MVYYKKLRVKRVKDRRGEVLELIDGIEVINYFKKY